MKRSSKILALVLAWLLAVSMVMPPELTVRAEEGQTEEAAVKESTEAVQSQETNEEKQYEGKELVEGELVPSGGVVEQTAADTGNVNIYARSVVQAYSGKFGVQLTGDAKTVYNSMVKAYVTNEQTGKINLDIAKSFNLYSEDSLNAQMIKESDEYKAAVKEIGSAVQSAMDALLKDYPQLFWISGMSYSWYIGWYYSGSSYTIEIDTVSVTAKEYYDGAIADIGEVNAAIDAAVSSISAGLPSSASLYDKVKAIHNYVVSLITYRYDNGVPSSAGEAHTVSGAVLSKYGNAAVCEGYAKTFKWICDEMGITSALVVGSSQGEGHMWNYVQMDDNKWYLVDCTWDDQSTIRYTYFLVGTDSAGFNGQTVGSDHTPRGDFSNTGNKTFSYPVLQTAAYVAVTGISLNKTTLAFNTKGAQETLVCTVSPASASAKNLVWKSSNTAVAQVSSDGVVTAVANGTAKITASTADGSKSAVCTVTVKLNVPLQSISLNKSGMTLQKGSTETLTVSYNPTNTTDSKTVTWKSSNSSVATVIGGKVSAISAGTAVITATVGTKTASCTVTVPKDLSITDFTGDTEGPLTVGSGVVLTVKAEGGQGTLKYKFYRVLDGNTKSYTFRDYSTANTVNCVATTPGTYTIYVDVMDEKGNVATKSMRYTWENAKPLSSVSLSSDLASPQKVWTKIKLTASATGGTGQVQYRFYRVAGGVTTVFRDYESSNEAYCNPGSGTYTLYVDAKDATGKVVTRSMQFTWGAVSSELKPAGFTSDLKSPQKVWTKIKLTALATGGTGNLQYQFYRVSAGKTTIFRAYGTDNTAYCNPGSGTYMLYVDVKDSSGKVVTQSMQFTWGATVQNLKIDEFTADLSSPQAAWTKIKLSVKASGGSGALQYRFYRIAGGTTIVFRDYSTDNEAYCNPGKGTYKLYVDVRDTAGNVVTSSKDFEWK